MVNQANTATPQKSVGDAGDMQVLQQIRQSQDKTNYVLQVKLVKVRLAGLANAERPRPH
jgi:hypothetical protein